MFVSYAANHAGDTFKMLNLDTKRIWQSRDVCWLAPSLPSYATLQLAQLKAGKNNDDDNEALQVKANLPPPVNQAAANNDADDDNDANDNEEDADNEANAPDEDEDHPPAPTCARVHPNAKAICALKSCLPPTTLWQPITFARNSLRLTMILSPQAIDWEGKKTKRPQVFPKRRLWSYMTWRKTVSQITTMWPLQQSITCPTLCFICATRLLNWSPRRPLPSTSKKLLSKG